MDRTAPLRVRKDSCLGCGICAESCPQQAISIIRGVARIDQSRCTRCQLCVDVCPQAAIAPFAPASTGELTATVGSLKQEADDLIRRIQKLQQHCDTGEREAERNNETR